MRPLHVAVALGAIGVAVVLYLALSTSDATAAKGDAASKAAAEARSPERAEASGAMPRAEEPV
ncbi:MAG TPA: hypothetical protein VKE69_01265, partial [Planctomycetota bacterium]|nr:hypothetical protein [Planctomycetota bacterium]